MKFQRFSSQPNGIALQAGSQRHSPKVTPQRTLGRRLIAAMTSIGQHWLKMLMGTSEPVVRPVARKRGDRAPLYSVYDPVTQERLSGLSEAEVRTWLDQRYYR